LWYARFHPVGVSGVSLLLRERAGDYFALLERLEDPPEGDRVAWGVEV